jgi:Flp pilus assembly protein TadG
VVAIAKRFKRFLRKDDGQAITEFAIILPVFMLLVMGILIVGHIIYAKTVVVLAASQGARVAGAVWDDDPAEARVKSIQTAETIVTNGLTGTSYDIDVNRDGNSVQVTVRYDYPIFVPLISSLLQKSTVELESTSVYRIL